jgi:(1->4)-alpha-D-glucan 1-alpha-D-glucosylmutase
VAAELTGEAADWPTIVRRAKRELLAGPLRPELERAARARDPHHPDPDALADEVVALDVYRTYEPGTPSEAGVRFAQLSTALAAKAIEDTALYRDPCLLALAEVGADPSMWSCPPEAFHARMRDAARHRPCSMLALSTHDTKRSADVRARLALLAGRHRAWAAAARRWSARARALDPTGLVDATTVLVLLQTLVGTWPIGAARVRAFARKAVREARRHTSWTDPDPVYEAAVDALIVALLGDGWFRTELEQFVGELLPAARVASLAQTTLLLTVPGVPDLYQGEELWRLSLVDPDNRRPVDFDRRRRLLDALRDPTAGVPDGGGPAGDGHGAAKLALVHRLLRLRAERPGAFGPGAAYAPLPTEGPGADRVLAFVRGGTVVVAVPRLEPFPGLGPGDGHRGPVVRVPAGRWVDACTGAVHDGGPVPAAALFASFPVAVLARSERRGS